MPKNPIDFFVGTTAAAASATACACMAAARRRRSASAAAAAAACEQHEEWWGGEWRAAAPALSQRGRPLLQQQPAACRRRTRWGDSVRVGERCARDMRGSHLLTFPTSIFQFFLNLLRINCHLPRHRAQCLIRKDATPALRRLLLEQRVARRQHAQVLQNTTDCQTHGCAHGGIHHDVGAQCGAGVVSAAAQLAGVGQRLPVHLQPSDHALWHGRV